MNIIIGFIIIVTFVLSSCGDQDYISLPLVSGHEWNDLSDSGVEFYSLEFPESGKGVLMLSRFPVPIPRSMIKGHTNDVITKVAQSLITTDVESSGEIYEVELLNGHLFYLTFIDGDHVYVQGTYMINLRDSTWSGQYTGPQSSLSQIVQVINEIK